MAYLKREIKAGDRVAYRMGTKDLETGVVWKFDGFVLLVRPLYTKTLITIDVNSVEIVLDKNESNG